MGTNFYLFTKNKKVAQKYAPYSYVLVDDPRFGYKIHIGKCSMGWLPLFEAHSNGIRSIKEYKMAYDTGKFKIYDEYNREYNWEEFEIKVLQHNGGIAGIMPREHCDKNPCNPFYDPDIPSWVPISHFDTKYAYMYFKDEKGYEFTEGDFS
jgi:hypothetical protein